VSDLPAGYESSSRAASDLAAPPRGPAPGARPRLDLDANRVPEPPPFNGGRTSTSVSVRVPHHMEWWLREAAANHNLSVNAYLLMLLAKARGGDSIPADCWAWLSMEAKLHDDFDGPLDALVAIIRHLADRYPYGAELR
jgi:hypothetical protein